MIKFSPRLGVSAVAAIFGASCFFTAAAANEPDDPAKLQYTCQELGEKRVREANQPPPAGSGLGHMPVTHYETNFKSELNACFVWIQTGYSNGTVLLVSNSVRDAATNKVMGNLAFQLPLGNPQRRQVLVCSIEDRQLCTTDRNFEHVLQYYMSK